MEWQEKRKQEISKILERTCQKFSITTTDLLSKSRNKELVTGRRFLMNVLFELFDADKMNHSDISVVVNRDRTSFLHHRAKHLNEYGRYKAYKQDYDAFKNDCKSDIGQ